ncbi:MAG: DciA family protein [Gammaproteobacteria bacterium]
MQKNISSYISLDLQKKAKLLHRLTLSLKMQLPEDLASHCWVAGIDNRTLTIVTDDPSRASIIRFQQREILKQLNQELSLTVKEYLNQIKVKICNVINGVNHPTKAEFLTTNSANHINQCAKSIKDLELQKAMQQLAKRGLKSTEK